MRAATKPIMVVTALAFIALMIFQWGMDITGRTSGSLGEIGRVNGEAVTYDMYMAAYQNLYDQVQAGQEEPITSQQNLEIEDAAWDEVVNQLLIRQELERRGITVTDDEIREAAQFSPPEELRPQFVDSTGQFDLQGYQTFLGQLPPDQLMFLEAYYRDVIPRGKLLRQVASGIYLSDAELWQRWRDQAETVEVRYVPFDPATRYPDADFPIERPEVEAYYRENRTEFEVPARATVKAAVLVKTPTVADTLASLERARALRQELVDGADFAEVARRESADQATAAAGGTLGTILRGTSAPALDSAVFAARLGVVTEPVASQSGFHLIEVTERWATDSASARHILVPIERTDESEIALLTLADSLEDLSEVMPLEQAAAQVGLQATTVDITATFPFLAGAGQIGEGSDWVFEEAAPGDVSPVFENAQALYALELVESEPAGVLPLEEATPLIESTLRIRKKLDRARTDAEAVATRARGGEPLVNVAADLGLEIRGAGPFGRNDFVPGLGRWNVAVGTAFALPVGGVSGPVATEDNVFVIEMLARNPADSLTWVQQKEGQRDGTLGLLRQQRLQEWIAALRASARIDDRRAEVLQPADSVATQMPLMF